MRKGIPHGECGARGAAWSVLDRRDPEGGQEAGYLHEVAAEPLDLFDEDLHSRRGDALEPRLQQRWSAFLKGSRRGRRLGCGPAVAGAAAARKSVLGHAVPERRTRDAELLGGPDHVPAGDVQRRDQPAPARSGPASR